MFNIVRNEEASLKYLLIDIYCHGRYVSLSIIVTDTVAKSIEKGNSFFTTCLFDDMQSYPQLFWGW